MPSEKNHAYYLRIFELYKKLISNLSPMYDLHSSLKKSMERHDVEIVKNL
jgi:hypothetical protein